MTKLFMVRHGQAEAGFDVADPGLSELGRSQAENVARELELVGPIAILTSPLRRTRETSLPLSRIWMKEPLIENAIAEIPTPPRYNVNDRTPWLRQFMAGSWTGAEPMLTQWRSAVLSRLISIKEDTVLFSHFIAINVAVGSACGDERVVAFSPANCSVTKLEVVHERLKLVERGSEAVTRVN